MEDIFKQVYNHGIPYPDYISKRCKDIIDWCTKTNPKKRPTCSEIYNKYFKDCTDENKLIND